MEKQEQYTGEEKEAPDIEEQLYRARYNEKAEEYTKKKIAQMRLDQHRRDQA